MSSFSVPRNGTFFQCCSPLPTTPYTILLTLLFSYTPSNSSPPPSLQQHCTLSLPHSSTPSLFITNKLLSHFWFYICLCLTSRQLDINNNSKTSVAALTGAEKLPGYRSGRVRRKSLLVVVCGEWKCGWVKQGGVGRLFSGWMGTGGCWQASKSCSCFKAESHR